MDKIIKTEKQVCRKVKTKNTGAAGRKGVLNSMKKFGKIIACALVAAASVSAVAGFAACSDDQETVTLSGSTSVYPLMEVLAEAYMEDNDVKIVVNGGGSGVGLSDAQQGNNDIGMISKAFDSATYTTLSYVNLCTDGIALITNSNCTVTNVTAEELVALYTAGTAIQSTITTAVGRDSGSGTRSAFDELVGIEDSYASGVSEIAETGNVISAIQSNTAGNTVGYVSAGSVGSTSDIKTLQFDGVDCTTANVKSGAYALSRPFNLVYRTGDISDAAQAFLTWLVSSDAQSIISSEGYVL